jgi:hypothetical protein
MLLINKINEPTIIGIRNIARVNFSRMWVYRMNPTSNIFPMQIF